MADPGLIALYGRRAVASGLVVLGLLTSACAHSSPPVHATYTLGHFPAVPTGSFSDFTAGTLQKVLDAAVKQGLPGITATVLAADGQAWSGAAGTADGMHPVEVRSQFGIASITKTVIAAEIMRLSERGLLRLNDPVSKHLPSTFHFDTNGATVENLLHMESGIPDPAPNNAALAAFYGQTPDPLRAWTPQEVLASVPAGRSKPGEHYVYEDANYMLLGLVIEETTGKSVAAALRSDVLADPRVSSMVYQPEERPQGPLALPFGARLASNGGGYLPSKAEASEGNGSGCMASDSGALALWGYRLFGGQLVSEQSLLAMTDFGDGFYGLGVFDQTKSGAWRGAGHAIGNGGWDDGGYSSALAVLSSQGIVIAILTNEAGDPKTLAFPVAVAIASALQNAR
jgi:CubicO group peptidase (beta-lactamase class C family)